MYAFIYNARLSYVYYSLYPILFFENMNVSRYIYIILVGGSINMIVKYINSLIVFPFYVYVFTFLFDNMNFFQIVSTFCKHEYFYDVFKFFKICATVNNEPFLEREYY
jgi:hypothetical protein